MRVGINLATEPFVSHRRTYVIASAVGGVLLLSLAVLLTLAWRERQQVGELRTAVQQREAELARLQGDEARLTAQLRQAGNSEVVGRNQFFNSLILPKAVSWTRMFADLGEVMPHNVRLTSVRPQVTSDGKLQLDMIVAAESSEPVVDLLRRMEASPLFGATSVSNFLPPSQTEPLYRYRVSVNYAQRL